jgi:hypothetical protein
MALGQDFLGLLDHDPVVQRGIGEHQLIDQFLRSQRGRPRLVQREDPT